MKCIDCDGEGCTPNGSCTGDRSGGWADTCDTCAGTGDMPPALCPHCNTPVKPYRESRIAQWSADVTWQVRCEQCWTAAPLMPTPEYAIDAWNDLFYRQVAA